MVARIICCTAICAALFAPAAVARGRPSLALLATPSEPRPSWSTPCRPGAPCVAPPAPFTLDLSRLRLAGSVGIHAPGVRIALDGQIRLDEEVPSLQARVRLTRGADTVALNLPSVQVFPVAGVRVWEVRMRLYTVEF